jgi:hypothetical protein
MYRLSPSSSSLFSSTKPSSSLPYCPTPSLLSTCLLLLLAFLASPPTSSPFHVLAQTIPIVPTVNTTDITNGITSDANDIKDQIAYQLTVHQGIIGAVAIGIGLVSGNQEWCPVLL